MEYENVLNQLLSEVERVYKDQGTITDEVLSALQYVLEGQVLMAALDLVDRKKISKLISPSGRYLFQVIGSSGTPYTLTKACSYCSCPAFKYSVLKRRESFVCKHILAIQLSGAMGIIKDEEVSNQNLSDAFAMML